LVRLLGVVPAALLLSGLFAMWAGPLAAPVAATAPPAPSAPPATPATNSDWPQYQHDPTHDGNNSQETILSASNVKNLGLAWTGDVSSWATAPVVAGGVAYVGSGDGKLYAFPAGCASGAETCAPLWVGVMEEPAPGRITNVSQPAVANGVIYIGASNWQRPDDMGDSGVDDDPHGQLYAFAAGCASGGETCGSIWTSDDFDAAVGTPTVADGVVYVTVTTDVELGSPPRRVDTCFRCRRNGSLDWRRRRNAHGRRWRGIRCRRRRDLRIRRRLRKRRCCMHAALDSSGPGD
jgi:outer membrane protein assembly factor BamB